MALPFPEIVFKHDLQTPTTKGPGTELSQSETIAKGCNIPWVSTQETLGLTKHGPIPPLYKFLGVSRDRSQRPAHRRKLVGPVMVAQGNPATVGCAPV